MEQGRLCVLGAGVIGMSTALELKRRCPTTHVCIVAKYFPGDRSPEYCSPQAGANWLSMATDNGRQEAWDAETYTRFGQLADNVPEAAITRMNIRACFDNEPAQAGVLSEATGKIWYERFIKGIEPIPEDELPEGSKFGMVVPTFMVNTQGYLAWLNTQCLKHGIEMRRAAITDIREIFREVPSQAYFNCTGLGSYSLVGVEDKNLYPTRGQVMLVETPKKPLTQMYFRSPRRVDSDTTYVFPRHPTGGVILGGCRVENDWNCEVDLEFAEDIKRRCCRLAPELGQPEDLKVIQHTVGLRPSRKGGPRLEAEIIDGQLVIHNYGASGAGYQASW
ncbi:putative D-amino acid oxidase [Thozetella sp. PMI_491]|nr:putative D-amino acid oxidase [Thozetella sp. PMI_491]